MRLARIDVIPEGDIGPVHDRDRARLQAIAAGEQDRRAIQNWRQVAQAAGATSAVAQAGAGLGR